MDELIEMARLLEQMAGKLRHMEERIAELERRQPIFPIPCPYRVPQPPGRHDYDFGDPWPWPPTPQPWWENPVIARSGSTERADG